LVLKIKVCRQVTSVNPIRHTDCRAITHKT
jgi:ribosomal protein L40E